MMQKPGDRRLSDRDLFLPESVFEFGQRDVRLLSYQLPHQILIRRQREIFVAAEFGRLDAARLPVKLEEANDRADADAPLLRSFRDGGPALDRPNHSPTQILRIRLRHACWPPPSRHLESCSRPHGNPRVSLLGKRSKREKLGKWLAKQGEVFTTEAVKEAGKQFGKWAPTAFWLWLMDMMFGVSSAAHAWLKGVGLHF